MFNGIYPYSHEKIQNLLPQEIPSSERLNLTNGGKRKTRRNYKKKQTRRNRR